MSSVSESPCSLKSHLLAFVLLTALAMIALHANPFAGETVAPMDRLMQLPGWSSVGSEGKVVHAERSDILDSQLPTWITLKNQIRSGQSPLWYPNAAGGGAVSLELFNPTFWLFTSIDDHALGYYLVGLLKLVVSGFGMFLLLKTYLRWLPALFGGIIFMLCGFNAAWFFWEHVSTAMWIPWLIWATVRYLGTGCLRWLPAITAASVLMIIGGFPSVAAFGFYSFALLVLVWHVCSRFYPELQGNLRTALFPFVAVALAFLISAADLMHFVQSMSSIDLSYRAGSGSAFRLRDLPLLFSYEVPSVVEKTAYIGFPAMLLAAIGSMGLRKVQDKRLFAFGTFIVLLLLVTVLISFEMLPHDLVALLPVFKNNPWGRLIVITHLAVACLAAFGLQGIMAALAVSLGRSGRCSALTASRTATAVAVAIFALQFILLVNFFNSYNAAVPGKWFYPPTPATEYVRRQLQPLQSVIADDSFLVSGTLGAYGIPEWCGHSFRTHQEKEVLRQLVPGSMRTATAMVVSEENIRYDAPLMEKLGVKYLLINKNFPIESYQKIVRGVSNPKWQPLNLERDILLLENRAVTGSAYFVPSLNTFDSFTDFSGVTVKRAVPDEIMLDYQRPDSGWVVLPMHLDAGWKAYVNGKPVEYGRYLEILPAIPVQGPSSIVFKYGSEALRKGGIFSAVGVVLFLAGGIWCYRSRFSAPATPSGS